MQFFFLQSKIFLRILYSKGGSMLQEQLKRRIEILGWSVATTAKRTGLHRDMISRLLRGKSTDPRLSTLRKLCKGLGLTLDELAGDILYDRDIKTP